VSQPALTLFGTQTSPYVRRIRIMLDEMGLAATFVDTTTDDGQRALRKVSPIWKVPTLTIDDDVVLDSRQIASELLARFDSGPLRGRGDAREKNIVTVVDGALDTAIKRFYLEKDGVDLSGSAFAQKEEERVRACAAWLDARCQGGVLDGLEGFGRAEIALLTTIEWFRFRNTYAVDEHANLVAFHAAHEGRESLRKTAPPA
jgi:glutathione S-transferase